MRIEKVSENSIKFTIEKDELIQRNLSVDDMKYGSNNVRSLFREMIEIANIKLGFANGTPLVVEAVPLKDGSMQVNVTRVSAPDELDFRFSKFSPIPGGNNIQNPDFMQIIDAAFDKIEDGLRMKQLSQNRLNYNTKLEDPNMKEYTKIFSFDSIDEASDACKALGFKGFVSSFYKDEKASKYYLVLSVSEEIKGGALFEILNKVCNNLSEYGEKVEGQQLKLAYFKEHYKVIIEKDAVLKLSLL